MLDLVREAYPTFVPFLHDVMEELGFSTTRIQEDIAEFLEYGPHYLMIQAQRGQAKPLSPQPSPSGVSSMTLGCASL